MPHTIEQLEAEKRRRSLIAEKERRQQSATAVLEPPASIDMTISDPNDAYVGMEEPNEIRKRASEVLDISIDIETPPEIVEANYENLTEKAEKTIPGTMQFGAGEPDTLRAAPERTKWQKFKNFFVGQRPPLPPDADRIEKVSRAFDIAVSGPMRTFLKFGKGMTLNAPDLMWAAVKRITPDDMWDDEVKSMNLDEAMDWAGGYNPSGFQKSVGEVAEFVGRLKTVAPIAQQLGVIGNTPKDISVLGKAFEAAKLFGVSAVAEQVSAGASNVIDPTEAEYGFEGPKAVLRDMALGAIFSFVSQGVKGAWSKLTPSETSRALKLLGLKKGASQEEITKAANNLARQYHPDKIKGYVNEFKKVIKARDLLRQGEAQDIVYRGQKVTIKPKVLAGKVTAEKAITKPKIQKGAMAEAGKVEGKVFEVYHGGPESATELDPKYSDPTDLRGVYFAEDTEMAQQFAKEHGKGEGVVRKYKVTLKNPASDAIVDAKEAEAKELGYKEPHLWEWVTEELKAEGYDGAIRDTGEIVAFNKESITLTPEAKQPAEKVKGIKDVKEKAIIEPPESPKVDTGKAGKIIPTGKLDPTNPKEALEIVSLHVKGEGPNVGGVFEEKFDVEKQEWVVTNVEYTSEQVDTAYRTVQKPVESPMPDTDLFVMPGKEKQMKAIVEKMAKVKGVVKPKKKGPKALTKPTALPKAKTKKEDYIKAVFVAASKEDSRYAIAGVFVEGDNIVATDGRRMFWAKGKWGKDGVYLDQAVLKKGSLGKLSKTDLKFPGWRDIVPDVNKRDAILIEDLETLLRHVRQAASMTTEESSGITIIVNKDGSLGFAAAAPEVGHVEVNVNAGGKILGAANPRFLMDAINFHAIRGNPAFEFYFKNYDRPIMTRSLDGKTSTITMPVNPGEPSEALKEAVNQYPTAKGKAGHPAMATGRDLGLQMEPATKKPISEREIIDHFERALKIPIRGKATHKMRIYSGWYAIRAKGIRMKVLRTLDTVAHEVGHHIDHWTNIRTKSGRGYKVPPGTADELMKLGKALYGDRKPTGGYKSEGVAEFVRMYLFGEDIETVAPNFTKFFNEQYLPNNKEVAAALTKAKGQITRWQQQGSRARIRSQRYAGPVKGTVKERIENFLRNIETDWRDELAPLRRGMKKAGVPSLAEERVESPLKPTQDPYFLATVFADKAGAKARFFALEGTTDMAGNQTGKSLMEVLKPVAGDIERFVDWAQAAKGLQLRKYGVDAGIDVKDMQYIYDKDKNPTYEKALKEWTEWSTAGLDYMVEAGAMPAKLRNKIREKHPIYIPFTRVFKEGEVRGRSGAGKGITKTGKPVHAIKGTGSSSGTLDPIMASLQQVERQISISHKVMVAKALANLSNKEGIAGLIWRVPPPMQATQFSAEQIKKDVVRLAKEHLGLELDGIPSGYLDDWDELLTVFSNAPQYKGKDNIVAIRDAEGKPTFYELSPELFSIVEGLDQYKLPPFVDIVLGMPTRAGRLGATGLNASFGLIRNIWRDMWTFTTLSKHAKGGPASALKGIGRDVTTQISDIADHIGIKSIPKFEDVQKFRALGGEMSVQIMHDQRGQKYLRESVLASNGKRYVFHTFKHPIDAMKHLFGVPEAGTRIGEFGPALKYAEKKWGKDSKDAAFYALYMGQDVTTNFTRHGRISKVVNQMTMFFNAGIQGPDKIYRTFKARPLRTSLTAIGALTIPAVYLWRRNRDKEWYKNMPAHEKYGYQHFEAPDGTITRFPVAFELGHIFQSLPVAHLDALYKADPNEVKIAVDKMLEDLNPIDWPTVIRPIMELKSNKDFAGRPIVPERVEGKLAEDQVKERTTALMKLIGESLNFSPAQIEHLVNSYTGGAYGRVAWLLEPKESEQSKSDIPVVGTLFMRDSYAPKAQIEEYYKRSDKLEQMYQSDKITSKEILKRVKYNRAGSALSEIWEKLRDEKTLKGREKLYDQAGKIIEQAKKPMTQSEIRTEIRENTYRSSGVRKDGTVYMLGQPHKGKEKYIKALKRER